MYKDSVFAAQCRRDDLLRSLEPLPGELIRVHGNRTGRIWAGAVGILGFTAVAAEAFRPVGHATELLVSCWAAMALTYVIAARIGRWRFEANLRQARTVSDDVFSDLARLEITLAGTESLRRVSRLEAASFVLPIAALSLLAPLSVHLAVGLALIGTDLQDFNAWVLISLLLVGHAHVCLLVLSVLHVFKVRNELDRGTRVIGATRGLWALVWTVAASSVPGVVFLCIPSLLVALTGLVFVPWMFAWVSRRAQWERWLLGSYQ